MQITLLFIFCLFLTGCQTAPIKDAPASNALITDAGFEEEHSSLFKEGSPREIFATDISFDIEAGEIKYTLPEPALVRVRIGTREGGPLLRHLVDWEKRDAGENIETWDKKDETGEVDFSSIKNLLVVLNCISLEALGKEKIAGTVKGFRKSPGLEISFPESLKRTEQGLPIISAITPVRVSLEEKDKKWLSETKYEVGMFIDYVFLMEDEEGVDPFTYHLDTKNLNDGLHTITANVIGYEGEVGTKSVKVLVKNRGEK